MKNLRRNKGFTLIEMLIVIVIIGLLLSLVAPNLMDGADKAKRQVASAQLKNIETALETFYLDVGQYPESLSELMQSTKTGWSGPYMKKAVPNDPWGKPFVYRSPGDDGKPYYLASYAQDGQQGGDGEAKDIVYP